MTLDAGAVDDHGEVGGDDGYYTMPRSAHRRLRSLGPVVFVVYCELRYRARHAPGTIRTRVGKCELETGDAIASSRGLADMFGVDRGMVRRALLGLENEGLITSKKRPTNSPPQTTRDDDPRHDPQLTIVTVTGMEVCTPKSDKDDPPDNPLKRPTPQPTKTTRKETEEELHSLNLRKSEVRRAAKAAKLFADDSQEFRAAKYLLGRIRKLQPDFRPKFGATDLQRWASEFDLVFRIDRRSPSAVKQVIDFVTAHPNAKTRSYLQSPGALRGSWKDGSAKFDAWRAQIAASTASSDTPPRVGAANGATI